MGDPGTARLTDIEGVVKWFDPKKGYGFIVGPEGQDIMVHFSKIEGDGFRVLKDGSSVRYDAELGAKGWSATKCVRLESPEVKTRPVTGYSRSPRR